MNDKAHALPSDCEATFVQEMVIDGSDFSGLRTRWVLKEDTVIDGVLHKKGTSFLKIVVTRQRKSHTLKTQGDVIFHQQKESE